jgi:general secretion pathway protein G
MLKYFRKLMKDEKGFTLIELMVVVVIIGILAAIAVPAFSEVSQKGKISRARADLRTLESTISIYYVEKNEYPEDLQVLENEGYIKAVPKDPWEKGDYTYNKNNGNIRLDKNGTNKLTENLYSYTVLEED